MGNRMMTGRLAEHLLAPYRKPWILIDRVLECRPDRIVCLKHVSSSDTYLIGHFPARSVYPGILLLEGIRQAGRLLLAANGLSPRGAGECMDVRFLRPVYPGQTILYSVALIEVRDGTAWLSGRGTIDDSTVIRAKLGLALSGE